MNKTAIIARQRGLRRLVVLLVAMVATPALLAQTQAEYWIDSDPGLGKGTRVATAIGDDGQLLFSAPTSGLQPGVHLLGIRALNIVDVEQTDPETGIVTTTQHTYYGPTLTQQVLVPKADADARITCVEYFWDADPGYGEGTALAIAAGKEVSIENMELSTADLEPGAHRLGIRAFGDSGWGPTIFLETVVPIADAGHISRAEYFWNDDPGFGQGTPIDIQPGETVTLADVAIPTTGIHGDAMLFIRYRGTCGWSPTLAYAIMVDAEGNYTLNAVAETSTEDRIYQSLDDVVQDFADCGVGNHVTLNIPTTQTTYTLDATSDEMLLQLAAISASMDGVSTAREAKTLGFKASEGSGNAVAVTTTTEGLPTVVDLFSRTWTENVALTINGTAYDFAAANVRSDEVCDESTTARSLSSISTAVTATWTAQPHAGTTLSGYVESGTGDLPAMTLANSGTAQDSLAYEVTLSTTDGQVLTKYTYYIYVHARVSLQRFSGLLPESGSSLDPGEVTLRWNPIGGATGGYRVAVSAVSENSENSENTKTFDTSETSLTVTVESGKQYTWTVTAIGQCDELTSPTLTFEGRLLPDLVVESITLPEAAQTGNTLVVKATVRNQGEGATTETAWTDRLYYTIGSTNFADAVEWATVRHEGNLAAGENYEATFTVTVPMADAGQLRVFVETDIEQQVMETNTDNNRTLSSTAAELSPFYMNADDLAALRKLYADFGGADWNGMAWDTQSEIIKDGNWSGVSFNEEGRVTAINLQGRGLTGALTEETAPNLPLLATLNLSRNALTGDVAQLTAHLPLLTTLNLSYNQVDEVSSVLPATLTSLDLSYQHRNPANKSDWPGLDQVTTQVVSVGKGLTLELPAVVGYDHKTQTLGGHPQLTVFSPTYQQLGTLSWSAAQEQYVFAASGWKMTASEADDVILEPTGSTAAVHSAYPGRLHFLSGDANLSGLVDVNDVQRTLNYILNQNNTTTFGLWAANTYADDAETINIQDIVCTVNIVLENEGETAAAKGMRFAPSADSAASAANVFRTAGRKVVLDAEDEIAAFCLELDGVRATQVKLLLNGQQWQMQTRQTPTGIRLMVFSPVGASLPVGTTELLRLGADAQVVSASATSPEAESVGVTTGDVTGIAVPTAAADDDSVYDLQGRKVSTEGISDPRLPRGVYIVHGQKVTK